MPFINADKSFHGHVDSFFLDVASLVSVFCQGFPGCDVVPFGFNGVPLFCGATLTYD